jgi:hypothetical protein
MAIHKKRGWIWTDEDKEWVHTWQRSVDRRAKQVAEQARRFAESVPEFAGEAEAMAARMAQSTRRLVEIDGRRNGRKYQQISPADARAALTDTEASWTSWTTFMGRADVRAAVNRANRAIRDSRQVYRAAVDTAVAAFVERAEGPEFAEEMRRWAGEIDTYAEALAWAAGSLVDGCDATMRQDLKRVLLVRFIRLLASDANLGDRLGQFLSTVPPPAFRALLEFVLGLAFVHAETHRLELARGEPLVLQLGTTRTAIANTLGMSANGLAADLRTHADASVLAPSQFDFLGYQLSVAARPT